jgi:hypothetical protein
VSKTLLLKNFLKLFVLFSVDEPRIWWSASENVKTEKQSHITFQLEFGKFAFKTADVSDNAKHFTTDNTQVKPYCVKLENAGVKKLKVEGEQEFKYFVTLTLLPQQMVRKHGNDQDLENDKNAVISGPKCSEMFIKFVS